MQRGETFYNPIDVGVLPYNYPNNFLVSGTTEGFYDNYNLSNLNTSYAKGQPSADVFYKFTTPWSASNVSINTCSPNTNFDTYLHVFWTDKSWLNSRDNGCNAFGKTVLNSGTGPNSIMYAIVEGAGSATGNYTLEFTNCTGCRKGSVNEEIVNDSENIAGGVLVPTPNPANHSFTIENIPFDRISIDIINNKGVLLKKVVDYEGGDIDLSGFSSGLYMLKILTSEGTTKRKLVVTK
ncbi:MAG: T9SS C-terminal target domain-containing protein [Cytophagales bacterium]|nr:MAG: T9SS C-terminal target domain-containing protein [Cytophagales bacterium]